MLNNILNFDLDLSLYDNIAYGIVRKKKRLYHEQVNIFQVNIPSILLQKMEILDLAASSTIDLDCTKIYELSYILLWT